MTSNQISYWNYRELVRSNRAKEAENYRSNLARETETARSNRAQEEIAYNRYLEEVRSNKANESIKWSELNEKKRSNLVAEQQKQSQVLLWNAEAGLTTLKQGTQKVITSRETTAFSKDLIDLDWYESEKKAKVVNTWADTAGKGVKGLTDIAGTAIQWILMP